MGMMIYIYILMDALFVKVDKMSSRDENVDLHSLEYQLVVYDDSKVEHQSNLCLHLK